MSLPSPASEYFRALPGWVRRQDPNVRQAAVLYASRGTFAPEVARGVARAAEAAGFDEVRLVPFASPLQDVEAVLRAALVPPGSDLLVGVGAFEDDVALARERARYAEVRHVAVVGAGLGAFGGAVGLSLEGVIGPSQWEPAVIEMPIAGPSAAWFRQAFARTAGRMPDYPAAQVFAVGVVFAECARRAGALDDDARLAAARDLETTTLYGRFRVDPETGRQVGHRVALVQWRGGRKVVIVGSGTEPREAGSPA